MSEFLPLETKTGRVRGTGSNTGTQVKPIDFSAVYVIGLAGVGGVTDFGVTPLVIGQAYIDVTFGPGQPDTTYKLVECYVENTVDATPLNIWPGIVTNKTTTGFRLQLNGLPDTGNYALHWSISGFVPVPFVATEYLLSGAASGPISSAATFTVALPSGGTLASAMIVTPHDGGAGGTFTPATVTLTTAAPIKTFTYTPASYGAKTISTTNNKGLTDPAPRTFTSVASTYTLSGPSSGAPSVPSTNFTVALPAGGVVPSTVTVTPSDGGGGGTFTPTTVNLSTGAPLATFTYTPASTGAKTLSVTNNGGLTNPGNLTYTVAVLISDGDPVGTWPDSSGNGHTATQSGTARPIYAATAIGGKPAINVTSAAQTGVDRYFTIALPLDFGVALTCFVVMRMTVGGGSMYSLGSSTGDGSFGPIFFGSLTYGGVAGSAVQTSFSYDIVQHIHTMSWDSVTYSQFVDGTALTIVTGFTLTAGPIDQIGRRTTAPCDGLIAEIILYQPQLSTTDRANIEKYLSTKYGIAVTSGGTAVQPDTVTGLKAWFKADSL
jgi:hypothetical protein